MFGVCRNYISVNLLRHLLSICFPVSLYSPLLSTGSPLETLFLPGVDYGDDSLLIFLSFS